MPLHVTVDPDEVRALVLAVVAADPVANTTFAAVAAGLDGDGAAPWAAHPVDAPLLLAARSRPESPVAVCAAWTDAPELPGAVAAMEPPAAAVAADPAVADAVAAGLGRPVTLRMGERLFRLESLVEPPVDGGAERVATPADLDLLTGWYEAFGLESFGQVQPDTRTMVAQGLKTAVCRLWTVDGTPVSMAVQHPVQFGVGRIGPVFTPREHRGHGYGSAVTAAATSAILAAAATPCLFTDLANPTSNKIYAALGYVPVLDRVLVRFS